MRYFNDTTVRQEKGKSVIILTAIDELMFDYFEVSKVLVIAPLRVAKSTWDEEAAKWDHLVDLKREILDVISQEEDVSYQLLLEMRYINGKSH